MSKFDKNKVISYLCLDEVQVGKKYYFGDSLYDLKSTIENEEVSGIGKLINVVDGEEPFQKDDGNYWQFIYPYEEPRKKLMTRRQFAEWLAKGCGEYKRGTLLCCYSGYEYKIGNENEFIGDDVLIRPWDSEEWIKPTYEIYLRDCKGVTQDGIDDVAWRDGC